MREQHRDLLARLDSSQGIQKILCVPAHFTEYDSRGVALSWPARVAVVIANSFAHHPSVIRLVPEPICFTRYENVMMFAPLFPDVRRDGI